MDTQAGTLAGMAYTQTDLDRLQRMVASGTLSIREGNVVHEFRSMAELMQALAYVRRELATQAAPVPRPAGGIFTFRRVNAAGE